MKFSPGMKAFHVGLGVVTLVENLCQWENVREEFPLSASGHDPLSFCWNQAGIEDRQHVMPTLYTLEEAEKMGFSVSS